MMQMLADLIRLEMRRGVMVGRSRRVSMNIRYSSSLVYDSAKNARPEKNGIYVCAAGVPLW
jgi:hypothetical protein